MLTTKRYDYVGFDSIQVHPSLANHRALNDQKVRHYHDDILKNGLLEPLVVWERNGGEYFLVGGFHRLNAIKLIRQGHQGYFDRIDVRVVAGDLEEMRALNLKLNADRLDAKVSEYFDTVIFLNNANWEKQRIASFLDKSVTWIEEIVRFVPGMDPRLRKKLDEGAVTWTKAKAICKQVLEAKPGTEKQVADAALLELEQGGDKPAARKPISVKSAAKRLAKHIEINPKTSITIDLQDLYSLFLILDGKGGDDGHMDRVRRKFPALLES